MAQLLLTIRRPKQPFSGKWNRRGRLL